MKKIDIVIIIMVFSLSLIIFKNQYDKINFNNDDNRVVEVYVKNELILTLDLNKNTKQLILIESENNVYTGYDFIDINQKYNITKGYDLLYIHDNGIEVLDADCPSKIIVRMGYTQYSNVPLLCIPRSLMIIIKGESKIYNGIPPIVIG